MRVEGELPTERARLRSHGPALLVPGSNCLDFDGLDAIAQEVGALPALVLAELVVNSGVRQGELLCRASERSLAADLSRWGQGFSRASVRKALTSLSAAGFAVLAGHGLYALAPCLRALAQPNLVPSTDQRAAVTQYQSGSPLDSPAYHPAPNLAPPPPPLVLMEYQNTPVVVEDISLLHSRTAIDSPAVPPAADLGTKAFQSAQALGLGPKALSLAKVEPDRALAWIDYAQSTPTVRSPAGLVYEMITAAHKPWPPVAATPRSPEQASPRVSAEEIRLALSQTQDPSGVPLGQSPTYHEVFLENLRALGTDDAASARAQYTAHFNAMRTLGLFEGRRPPFSDTPAPVSAAGL